MRKKNIYNLFSCHEFSLVYCIFFLIINLKMTCFKKKISFGEKNDKKEQFFFILGFIIFVRLKMNAFIEEYKKKKSGLVSTKKIIIII